MKIRLIVICLRCEKAGKRYRWLEIAFVPENESEKRRCHECNGPLTISEFKPEVTQGDA